MNKSKLISVGIPVHNQAGTIGETIESLLRQDVPPAEIVVSENHSKDGTREVLERYAKHVRIVAPPAFIGMAANWNFCASQLVTPWFALLSGDDLALPNYVRVLERGALARPDAVLVRAGWQTIDAHGKVLERRRLLSVRHVTAPPRTIREQLHGPKHSFAAFALRAGSWRECRGFPEELNLLGDWGMWLRMAALGTFIYEDEIISSYRTGLSEQTSLKRLVALGADELYLARNLLLPSRSHGISEREIRQALRQRLADYLSTLGNFRDQLSVAQIDPTMREWCAVADRAAWWEGWKKGAFLAPRNRGRELRHLLRRMATKLLR